MIRTYGEPPYNVAVIHGGPGDLGSLSPVARQLSQITGVIEPIQSKHTVDELVAELDEQLNSVTEQPLILIGHSWGAWLVILYAARYPQKVKHIVLIGSGPFEERFVPMIQARRMAKLSKEETHLFNQLILQLSDEALDNKDELMNRLGKLVEKTDNYQIDFDVEESTERLPADGQMYSGVWPEAAKMRSEGKLIAALKKITCPITIIQGSEDPHPIEGLTEPLANNDIQFQHYLLPFCGHSPFKEKLARQPFYDILNQLIIQSEYQRK